MVGPLSANVMLKLCFKIISLTPYVHVIKKSKIHIITSYFSYQNRHNIPFFKHIISLSALTIGKCH